MNDIEKPWVPAQVWVEVPGHVARDGRAGGNLTTSRRTRSEKAAPRPRPRSKCEVIRALHKAMAGDVQAAKVWLEYVVASRSQGIEFSGPDGDPVKIDMARFTTLILARSIDATFPGPGGQWLRQQGR